MAGERQSPDAYAPAEIAERVANQGVYKASLPTFQMFALAFLAGAFISLGGQLYTVVIHDSKLSLGLTLFVGGLAFSVGLILVVLAGAELFTGNNLMIMAFVSGKISSGLLLRNWIIVYLGNLAGALSMVAWIYLTGQWHSNGSLIGVKALAIAAAKANLPFWAAFSRGTLCNVLVALAVWLCFGARTLADKILAIPVPIAAFVASGFEHSVANMYFIPAGMLLRRDPAVLGAAAGLGNVPDLSSLSLYGFFNNLIAVTLGNILGGAVLVGPVYWAVYLKKE